MGEHWARSFRNYCASRDFDIQRLRDVEPRNIVSVSNYTGRLFAFVGVEPVMRLSHNKQFLASLPIPEIPSSWQGFSLYHVVFGRTQGIELTAYRTISEHSTTMLTPVYESYIDNNYKKIFKVDRPRKFESLSTAYCLPYDPLNQRLLEKQDKLTIYRNNKQCRKDIIKLYKNMKNCILTHAPTYPRNPRNLADSKEGIKVTAKKKVF